MAKEIIKKFKVETLKTRLDKFLAEQCESMSRSQIQRDIENGQMQVNSVIQKLSKFIVRVGDEVIYKIIPELPSEPKNIPIKTLYNNHGLLILDKPAGLPVHPGAGFKGDSLAQGLLYHFKDIRLVGEEGRNGIVHRLDKDTSGVMLVALTQEMYLYLKKAFLHRTIDKEYTALVKGKVLQNHGVIEKPLGKSKKDFRKYTTDRKDMILEKPSKTEYWVLEHLSTPSKSKLKGLAGVDDYTLIRVKLHTGRTHQIRVHFSSIAHPLVGDELYGKKAALALGLTRQFLHSTSVRLKLPNETWLEMSSRLPHDLRNILEKLQSKIFKQL